MELSNVVFVVVGLAALVLQLFVQRGAPAVARFFARGNEAAVHGRRDQAFTTFGALRS